MPKDRYLRIVSYVIAAKINRKGTINRYRSATRLPIVLFLCAQMASCAVCPATLRKAVGHALATSVQDATAGNVYYVAIGGSDSNPGTRELPWGSIQKAADTMAAGDSTIVLAGVYNERVHASKSGMPGARITYRTEGAVTIKAFYLQGDYTDLQGFTFTPTDCTWDGAIDVSGSYCVVEGNTIKDSTRIGIVTPLSAVGCIIRGNTVARVWGMGMDISGSNNLIENNDISDIRDHLGTCTGGDSDAFHFHGTGNVFRGNYIHDLVPANQSSSPHVDAFQTYSAPQSGKPAAKNCIIEGNHIFWGDTNTGLLTAVWKSGVSIYGFMIESATSDPCDNLIIRNNLVESFAGLNANGVNGLKIYNNTFRSDLKFTSTYNAPVGISMDQEQVTNVEIYNNILVDFTSRHFTLPLATGSYDHNLMWNSDGSDPGLKAYTIQPHDKYKTDPLFVANFTNLHLQPNSPCIDAGITIAQVADDYDGNHRPQGLAHDIGAFEY